MLLDDEAFEDGEWLALRLIEFDGPGAAKAAEWLLGRDQGCEGCSTEPGKLPELIRIYARRFETWVGCFEADCMPRVWPSASDRVSGRRVCPCLRLRCHNARLLRRLSSSQEESLVTLRIGRLSPTESACARCEASPDGPMGQLRAAGVRMSACHYTEGPSADCRAK